MCLKWVDFCVFEMGGFLCVRNGWISVLEMGGFLC